MLQEPTTKHLVTPVEAAEMLGVKAQTLALWRSTGRYGIPYIAVGRLIRYRRADLEAWLQSRTVGAEAK